MDVRGPQAGDLDRMYALDVVCFERPFRFSRAAMRHYVLEPGALVRLAVGPEECLATRSLLGFCIVHLQRGEVDLQGYIVTLDVHPGCRQQGVATELMLRLHKDARAAGAKSMYLHVYNQNQPAMRLYERLGYRAEGILAGFYGRGLHASVYRLSLAEH